MKRTVTRHNPQHWSIEDHHTLTRRPVTRTTSLRACIYKAMRTLVDVDVRYVYAANKLMFRAAEAQTHTSVRTLTASLLSELVSSDAFELEPRLLSDFKRYGYSGAVAFCLDVPVGIALFHNHPVDGSYLKPGCIPRVHSAQLPPSSRHIFDLHVSKAHRGLPVVSAMIEHIFRNASNAEVNTLVAETELSDPYNRKTLSQLGFAKMRLSTNLVARANRFEHWPSGFIRATGVA